MLLLPRRMTGSSPLATQFNMLVDALRALSAAQSVGTLTDQTTFGVVRSAKRRPTPAPSGVELMELVSYNMDATDGDYLVCRPDGGDSGGDDDVNVAVEPQLQSSITTQTLPDASEWDYTAYTEATQERTATSGATELTEYISPPFIAGDRIPVQRCSNTDVTVDGKVAALIALTGRQWASPAA